MVCGICSRKKYGYGNPELHMTNGKLEHNLDALQYTGAEEPVSVPSLLRQTSRLHPHVIAIRAGEVDGEWKEWSYQALLNEVEVVARALIESGLQRHHSVAILGGNSPQWVIAHLAAIFAG